MIINRHNYEEFFILYLDNELNSADRRLVEAFIEQHPDLGEELQLLEQTRLELDPAVVFDGKESLMKPVGLGQINADNQEEWLVQYIDNELDNEQKAAVEIYAANNPSVKTELELLQKTKLRPENSITFFNKESLYRREESPVRRLVPLRLWRVAAAVFLFIALTIGGYVIFNNNKPEGGLAEINTGAKKSVPVKVDVKKQAVEQTLPEIAKTNTNQFSKKNDIQTPVVKKNDDAVRTIKIVNERKEEVPVLAVIDNNPNNLPDASRNPNMNGSLSSKTTLPVNGLTIPQENTSPPLVTSATAQSLLLAKNTLTTDEDEPEKKTKFRGLLRTLTRTFEKTTNIKATDDDDRLLVAGLAIRL
jgi:anti-sigma factor RsiW